MQSPLHSSTLVKKKKTKTALWSCWSYIRVKRNALEVMYVHCLWIWDTGLWVILIFLEQLYALRCLVPCLTYRKQDFLFKWTFVPINGLIDLCRSIRTIRFGTVYFAYMLIFCVFNWLSLHDTLPPLHLFVSSFLISFSWERNELKISKTNN